LAGREHPGPFGAPVRVSRQSLDRWILAWRRGGFDALLPAPRQVTARTPAEVLDLAAALKRENPQRTAAQVVRILRTHLGWTPSESTVLRLFTRLELSRSQPGGVGAVFGRFEAERPNQLWTGDALHGPLIAGRKTYLFAFIDDHSRAVVGHRFGYAEDTVRLAAALRPALAARGVPEAVYVDNGSAFVDAWLRRALAVLGIKLTHSTPGRPEGRGKIERFFATVRGQFLVEVTGTGEPGRHHVTGLGELNRLFTAWVEQIYHRQVHSETGQAPIERFTAGGPFPLPGPAALREAFLWSAHRQVTKTATVSLLGNVYQVEADLVGRQVELVYDPFDLTTIEVRLHGKPMGLAIPHRIGRHTHPKARPETPPAPAPAASGIAHLPLIDTAHHAELAATVNYAALLDNPTSPTIGEHTDRNPR
jgi:putative transposase